MHKPEQVIESVMTTLKKRSKGIILFTTSTAPLGRRASAHSGRNEQTRKVRSEADMTDKTALPLNSRGLSARPKWQLK
jgi:hypothetical protein